MILCLGVTGAGKSMLLKCLKDRSALLLTGDLPEVVVNLDDDPQPVGPAPLLASVATVGTDLIKLSRPGSKRNSCPEEVEVREVGGSIAPLWKSFVESGATKAVLYVVDSSAPEMIGTSTIHLVELLSTLKTDTIPVLVVFSKTDAESCRPLQEMKNIMRLDQIMIRSRQPVTEASFNFCNEDNIDKIFDWCLMQQDLPPPDEPDIMNDF